MRLVLVRCFTLALLFGVSTAGAFCASPPTWQQAATLVEPFDAPSLDELDKTAEWVDQPVLDGLELLREAQATEKPLATPAEALRLRNDGDETNREILSGLGRLPAAESQVDWEATMVRHIAGDIKSSNPLLGSSSSEFEILDLTGFQMFGFDWTFQHFASKDTVVSWQTSKDHMLDKIVLRDDLVWSDGKPITAYDVEFTFFTILNPKTPITTFRTNTGDLRWVKAYDAQTVVFFQKAPLVTSIESINYPVVPKHVYEQSIPEDETLTTSDYHIKYEAHPVSGGPYKLVERSRGEELVLERRDDYYTFKGKQVRSKPYFKRVRFRVLQDSNTTLVALKKGDIDEAILVPEQWQTQTTDDDFYRLNTKARGVEWVNFYIGWNSIVPAPEGEKPGDSPFFSDPRVRKAMSYTLDHDEMLNVLCCGLYEPCNGIFYPTAWMAPKKPLPYYQQDLDKAVALLTEAGWTDSNGDGVLDKEIDGTRVRFEFSILCNNSPLATSIAALLKLNLDQIGIICNVRPLEYAVFQQKTHDKEFQAMLG
ncbi:MAG TPA: ABC transporter substrate-binding protein, partial [Pirellulales bacterium]|nr:ABC transporter substrate-binding protein [Pirellulales bacterium]